VIIFVQRNKYLPGPLTMNKISAGAAPFYEFENLCGHAPIMHFVTTREGGTSSGNFSSMNMGFGTDDIPEKVLNNRRIMADSVGISLESFVFANQVHGNHIEVIDNSAKGSGAIEKQGAISLTDGLITSTPGICLFVMAADCVSLLFYDPVQKVIAAVHAGWRGTILQIARKTVEKMALEFSCKPSDILVGIGPSIGPCCYTVGKEVENAVQDSFGTTEGFLVPVKNSSSKRLDLWYSNQFQLENAGIQRKNIETAGICTFCNHQQFFSSRFDNGNTGRFGAGIMLNMVGRV